MRFLIVLIPLLITGLQGPGFAQVTPAGRFNGKWRVKFSLTGYEKNVVLDAKENGAGFLRLLDTGPDDKPVENPVPAAWSQLTNNRVSFSTEAELPIGTCCREVGTLIFKGKFTSSNTVSGILIFVTSVDQDESPFKFRSEVGSFVASRAQ